MHRIDHTTATSGGWSATGDTANGSPTITSIADTSGVSIGDYVTVSAGFGSDGKAAHRVVSKTVNSITLDINAAANESSVDIASVDNLFTEGHAAGGLARTIVTPEWANGIQEELGFVIEQTGLSLSKLSNQQLLNALLRLNKGKVKGLYCEYPENSGSNYWLNIRPGFAITRDGAKLIESASVVSKNINAAWAAGSGAGGNPGITLPESGQVYLFAFKRKSDDVVDFAVDTDPDAATIISGIGDCWFALTDVICLDSTPKPFRFTRSGITRTYPYVGSTDRSIDGVAIPNTSTTYALRVPSVPFDSTLIHAAGAHLQHHILVHCWLEISASSGAWELAVYTTRDAANADPLVITGADGEAVKTAFSMQTYNNEIILKAVSGSPVVNLTVLSWSLDLPEFLSIQ